MDAELCAAIQGTCQAYYRCAMMEVATKFNVLNEELSLQYDRNPIESVKTRLKSLDSIVEKASRKGVGISIDEHREKHKRYCGRAGYMLVSERYLYACRILHGTGRYPRYRV